MLVHNDVTSYPSTADKILVRFIGFANTVGNAGCYKVYNPETGQVLYRSLLERLDDRLCEVHGVKPFQPLHANGENDDVPVGELVKSREGDPSPIPIGIDNMINRSSFLLPPNEDGSRQQALITGVVEDF